VVTAYIGVGTNLGDRSANLRKAIDELCAHPALELLAESSVYETEPWGYTAQPSFLNMVIGVLWSASALELLAACQDVERRLGRVRENDEGATRWGPRTIDLDLLLFDRERIVVPELVVPHPRMHKRAFVMVPLAELDGEVKVEGRTTREWARELSEKQGIECLGRLQP